MISHVMPDHVSGVLAGSSHCFMMDPRPPSSSSTRRSVRLAFRLDSQFSPVSAPAAASSGPAAAVVLLRSFSHTPGFNVFFYSNHLPCFIHLAHGFSPALHIISYSASPGVRLQFCHVSTSSSPLCRRSIRPLPLTFTLTKLLKACL
ncbi:hypothetical protein CRENBAI_002864 [Crenichthys baileyi]|uniref:Uncharacterized protein n=1 Tax=Crenichthys baileyi TaxID=28760 RepID=A0AAV9SJK0_9TELE